jgi:uncharacterized Rossmann fold enzyme
MINRLTELRETFLSFWYPKILADFGYDIVSDLEAAEYLKNRIKNPLLIRNLAKDLIGKDTIIFAPGPSLPLLLNDIIPIKNNIMKDFLILAVDGAYNALKEKNMPANILITDLDGIEPNQITDDNLVIFLHAHGDNIQEIKTYPERLLNRTVGTCQVDLNDKINNIGGFTDGDRAIALCEIFLMKKVYLVGMDFGNKIGKYSKINYRVDIKADSIKRKKLFYASKLIKYMTNNSQTKYIILNYKSELNFLPLISFEGFKKTMNY